MSNFSKEDAKGCGQVILIMIGLIFISMIGYAILNGIDRLLSSVPWFLWPIILILGIWAIQKK